MFRCVPCYGFVGSRSRGAGGLASPGFSGDPSCEKEHESLGRSYVCCPGEMGE